MYEVTPMILSDEGKVFACICIALFIFIITALLLGEERKSKCFQKRKTYSFFLRRGLLGEWLHFGYPCTAEGYGVAAIMLFLIGLSSYIIYAFF